MAQFFAYKNSNKATQKTFPYLLDIQSNLLEDLRTTVVVPLCAQDAVSKTAITKLCPMFKIEGKPYIALTQQLAGIDRKLLGKPVVDLSSKQAEIIAALDFLVSGV
ncbi:MAG TPA: CcdB family protein [Limnobacter sp.]|nr:CcdB family protein [Limnobacter sp.]